MRLNLPKKTILWSELWRLEPFCITFLLQAVYDTLPINLHKWRMREDPLCGFCGGKGRMARCKTSFSTDRYRWCHDKVFSVLTPWSKRGGQSNQRKTTVEHHHLCEEGQRPVVSTAKSRRTSCKQPRDEKWRLTSGGNSTSRSRYCPYPWEDITTWLPEETKSTW